MTTTAERVVRTQRNNLKKVHNKRFTYKDYEYRIEYVGGLSEYIAVDGRKIGTKVFKSVTGFAGYKFQTAEDVFTHAKTLVMNIVDS